MLYFAYDANMDWDRLTDGSRCPLAQFLFRARLPDHRLAFTRFSAARNSSLADIVPARGGCVWGVVYHVEDSDLPGLYSSVEYQPGCETSACIPIVVKVEPDVSERRHLLATTFHARHREAETQPPGQHYLSHLLNGARHWSLPEEYVDELLRLAGV